MPSVRFPEIPQEAVPLVRMQTGIPQRERTKLGGRQHTRLRTRTKTNLSSAKEKYEVLEGWTATEEFEDTGICDWAKRRGKDDRKSGVPGPSKPWTPYTCTVISKCRSIEDVQVYIDDSLGARLRRPQNCKLIPERTLIAGELDKKPIDESKSKPSSPPAKQDSVHTRAKRLIQLSQNRSLKQAVEEEVEPSTSAVEQDEKPSNEQNNENDEDSQEKEPDDVECGLPEIKPSTTAPPPAQQTVNSFKLSYTNSNIKLKGLFDSGDEALQSISLDNMDKRLRPDVPGQGASHKVRLFNSIPHVASAPNLFYSPYNKLEHTYSDLEFAKQILQRSRGMLSHRLGEIPNPERMDTTLKNQPAPLSTRTAPGEGGMGSDTTLDLTGESNSENRPKSTRGQKAPMLILKKVDIDDEILSKDDDVKWSTISAPNSSRPLTGSRSCKPSISANLKNGVVPNQKSIWVNPEDKKQQADKNGYHQSSAFANGINDNGSKISTSQFQLSDLLPAVDKSLRRSLTGRMMTADSVDNKLKYGHFDDKYSSKESTDLVQIQERVQQTIGPPPFRAHSGKNSLHRAKDTVSKRLVHANNIMDDGADGLAGSSRWLSSTGKLYGVKSTRSAPSARSTRSDRSGPAQDVEASIIVGRLSQKSMEQFGEKVSKESRDVPTRQAVNSATVNHNRVLMLLRQKDSS